MQLLRMQEIFSAISKGGKINVTEDEISFLVGKELLSSMSAAEYEKVNGENKEKQELNRNLERSWGECHKIETRITEIEEFFRTFVAKISLKTNNDKKRSELEKLKEELATKHGAMEKMKKRRDELGQSKADTSGYMQTGAGYVKITEKGKERARFVQSLSERLKNVSCEQMEKEIGKTLEVIKSRSGKIHEALNLLVQKKKFNESENTAKFAMVLSTLKGDMDENISRAHIVDDRLYGMDFTSSERLDAVSFMVLQEGNMDRATDRLVEMFFLLCGDAYSKNYSTWKLAASMQKVPGGYALDKYKRFNNILNAMKENGWSKRSTESSLIAFNLAKKDGSATEIVEEFVSLRNKMTKRGVRDCFSLNVANLILEQAGTNFDHSADKFMKVLDIMKANNWSTSTSYYPLAAILASMKGPVEENLLFLKETTELVKKMGFRNPNHAAAIIIAGVTNELDRKSDSGESIDKTNYVEGIKDFDSFERNLLEWMVLGLFDQ